MPPPIIIEDFSPENIEKKIRSVLEKSTIPVAIWLHFSEATIQCIKVLREMELEDQVIVSCFDANPEIIEYLIDGGLFICAAQQPQKMGRESVNALALSFVGGKPAKEISIPILFLTQESTVDMRPIIINNICLLSDK